MGPDNSLTSPLCSPDIVRPQTAHDPEHQDVVVSYNQLDHMRLVDTDEDDDEKLEIKNHFSAEVTVDCVDLTGSPEVRVKDECVDLTENWFDEGRMKMWHEQVHAQIEPIEYEVEIKPEVMNNDVATTSAVEVRIVFYYLHSCVVQCYISGVVSYILNAVCCQMVMFSDDRFCLNV